MTPQSKDILITGASGTLGSAIARRLARAGFTLHLTARRANKLASLEREVAALGIRVVHYELDLSHIAGCKKTVQTFFQKAKEPFGLVCNAGNMGALGRFTEADFRVWTQGLTENFFSHAAMIQSFAERFRAKHLKAG